MLNSYLVFLDNHNEQNSKKVFRYIINLYAFIQTVNNYLHMSLYNNQCGLQPK